MALPKGLFAESRFRRSSADVALLAAATELTPNTAIAFACAAAYYLVEMFATQGDRDRSGNDDVRYFATTAGL